MQQSYYIGEPEISITAASKDLEIEKQQLEIQLQRLKNKIGECLEPYFVHF